MTVILTAGSREAAVRRPSAPHPLELDPAHPRFLLTVRGTSFRLTDDMDAAVAIDGLAVIPPSLGWVQAPAAATSTPPA